MSQQGRATRLRYGGALGQTQSTLPAGFEPATSLLLRSNRTELRANTMGFEPMTFSQYRFYQQEIPR